MRRLGLLLVSMLMVLSMSTTAFASNEENVKNRLRTAISEYVSGQPATMNEIGQSFSISNLSLNIDDDRLTNEALNELGNMTNEELNSYVASAYQSVLEDISNIEVTYSTQKAPGSTRAQWGQDRYGDVWCGIPNGGWADIRIHYNVQWTDDGGFNGATYYSSWKTNGATVGSWEEHYGDATVVDSSQVDVTSTGTITYGIPDTPLSASFDATFLHEDTEPYEI